MPYVGNIPAEKYATFEVQHFTTSATTSYTLTHAVSNELDLRLVLNNVVQQPGGSYAYTASATTLTLSSATTSSDTMYCVYIGKAVQTVAPGAGTVSTTALTDNAVTNAKLADATQGDILYYGASGTPAQLGAGTSGYVLQTQGAGANPVWAADTDTVTTLRPNTEPFFINANMQVAQRGTSFAQPDSNNDAFPVDRFNFLTGSIGAYTSTQEALTSGAAFNAGLKMAARIDCTTAVASPDAGDYFYFQYNAESQDCLAWKKGTTGATVMTLSFWVKSNKTGTAQVNLRDMDNDRMVCALYTISSGDTWEQKVVTFPMETSNPMNNDNGTGFRFQWPLGGGSTYNSGTAPTAWEARVDADTAANSLDINDNTANDWAITGIQAEVGTYTSSTLPPFQFESYGDNLDRCQRYYFKSSTNTNDTPLGSSAYYQSSSRIHIPFVFPVTMRSAPTLVYASGSGYYQMVANGGADGFDDLTINDTANIHGIVLYNSTQVSGTAGHGGSVRNQYNGSSTYGSVAFNSEL